MNLVFLGPPGSGKGTQAVRLAAKLGLIHLSTGDLLRDAVKRSTDLGKQAEGYMKRGELVPDELIIGLIENQITDGKLDDGFILDGFPRTIPQADGLKGMLKKNNISLDMAILFDVSDDEIVRRLSGRWYCPQCSAGYNYPAQMPKVEGCCDRDNTQLQRRPDDEESVVRNRLEVYQKQTKPIEDFYRRESILVEVNAQQLPDEVFQAVVEVVSSKVE
jgi:adenylate kinase